MSKSIQFRRSTAILTLVAASIGGGLIAAFAVATHANAPVYVTAKAASNPSTKASEISSSFADVIEKASPAVVNISSTRVIKASDQEGQGGGQGANPFMNDPFFRQFFGGQGQGAQPRDQRESGLGSGIIVSPQGYILTNNHVVEKATILKVTLLDGRQFPAKVVGADPQSDVAVVKIDANNLPTLPFADSGAARVGDLCFAIGNPFGYDHTVTMGIVSAKGRSLEHGAHLQDFIQTDASINPGNSGGALINAKGELIGMNTAIITGGSSFGGEAGNIGIGFAVPSDMAKRVMDQLIKNGKVSRGYIGVMLEPVTPDLAQQFGLKDIHAAIITDVTPGAPGAKAGLKGGDAITAIDGQDIKDSNDLQLKVTEHAPGSTVSLNVMRDGKPETIKVTLGTRPTAANFGEPGQNGPGNKQGNNENGNAGKTSYGITVQALTPDVAQDLQLPSSVHGVVVDSVDSGSPASEEVTRGDVISGVNRHPVSSVAEFQRLMGEAGGKSALLTVNRRGVTTFVVVQPNK
jgi:Do/DeqQ family serine protease